MQAATGQTTAGQAAGTNRRIDGARLWASLMEMAEIGATPRGGVRRLQSRSDLQSDVVRSDSHFFEPVSYCSRALCFY